MTSIGAFCIGFILDLIIGDPYWLPHPVRWIGRLIHWGEKWIRCLLPKNTISERVGGALLTLLVVGITGIVSLTVLKTTYEISTTLGFVVECIMYYQILATKCLKVESMKVYDALSLGDLPQARNAVAMIVGRDTASLDEIGVAKAAIETVAENTSDGIIGPLLFCALGGAPLGFMYKAINTLDSMIGYQNEKYYYFGTFAAKLDDVINFIPARFSAYMMLVATLVCGMNIKNAFHVYRRDRFAHKSPNSAHTEAVAAGALSIELGGDSYYFGKKVSKPTIGDPIRPVAITDIIKVNQLMYATSILTLIMIIILFWIV